MATKKVERGAIWFPTSEVVAVRPADGVKFSLEELQTAVGGYIEMIVPVTRGHRVYVNEEGAIKRLPLNPRTWEFADERVYVGLNGYAQNWMVAGGAMEVFKLTSEEAVKMDGGRISCKQAVRS
jgi:hypothetical protein